MNNWRIVNLIVLYLWLTPQNCPECDAAHLNLTIYRSGKYKVEEKEQQEIIDTKGYDLRRRRKRSLEDGSDGKIRTTTGKPRRIFRDRLVGDTDSRVAGLELAVNQPRVKTMDDDPGLYFSIVLTDTILTYRALTTAPLQLNNKINLTAGNGTESRTDEIVSAQRQLQQRLQRPLSATALPNENQVHEQKQLRTFRKAEQVGKKEQNQQSEHHRELEQGMSTRSHGVLTMRNPSERDSTVSVLTSTLTSPGDVRIFTGMPWPPKGKWKKVKRTKKVKRGIVRSKAMIVDQKSSRHHKYRRNYIREKRNDQGKNTPEKNGKKNSDTSEQDDTLKSIKNKAKQLYDKIYRKIMMKYLKIKRWYDRHSEYFVIPALVCATLANCYYCFRVCFLGGICWLCRRKLNRMSLEAIPGVKKDKNGKYVRGKPTTMDKELFGGEWEESNFLKMSDKSTLFSTA